MFAFGLSVILSCHPQNDAELYQMAIQQIEPMLCLELSDEEMRGECASALVASAPNHTDNERVCAALTSEKWKGECHFQMSDAGQLIGEKAKQMCAKSGPFEEDCLRHAAARDVEMNVHLADLKQAKSLLPRIYGTVKQYLLDSIAQPMARDMLVRMIASHQPNQPFSNRFCEGLTPDTCAQIYIIRSLGSGVQDRSQWESACGTPLTPKRASELSLALYLPEQQTVVDRAWKQLCQTSR